MCFLFVFLQVVCFFWVDEPRGVRVRFSSRAFDFCWSSRTSRVVRFFDQVFLGVSDV